jgi:hypothetical protein
MNMDDIMIRWIGGYTDYHKRFDSVIELNKNIVQNIYSFDTHGISHLPIIIGVLRLSSRTFNTTNKKGYITKRFDPLFNITPSFQVKTNKLKDFTDKYVAVRIVIHIDKLDNRAIVSGVIDRYIGDVGDINIENEICVIIATAHWSSKIDKTLNYTDIGVSMVDLTPIRIDTTTWSSRPFIVSVDPEGSKDIDDAISIQKSSECFELWSHDTSYDLKIDTYTIGIHIADPSSYIIEDSIIDLEVSKRVETYYGISTTNHMFPTTLSTDVFSLVSKQPRRAFSVFLMMANIDNKWTIIAKRICKTVIMVDMNTSYDKFQSLIMTNSGDLNQHKNIDQMILIYSICRDLFRSTLNKIEDNSKIMIEYNSKKMIESLMVLANVTVAETMVKFNKSNTPIIMRSQKSTMYDDITKKHHGTVSNYITRHLQLKNNSAVLKIFDSMSDDSHSALGLKFYTHFTSPIRRYSDILVHRVLYNLINNIDTFKLDRLNSSVDRIDQMFKLNHYKKFYRLCNIFQQNILLQHMIITESDILPMYNVIELEGVILDVQLKADKRKIRVNDTKYIIKVCDSLVRRSYPSNINETDRIRLDIVYNKIDQHIVNTIQTVYVTMTDNTSHITTMAPDLNCIESEYEDDDACVDSFNTERFKIFSKIQYKICGLKTDVVKIVAYI